MDVARSDVRKAEALHKIMSRLTRAHPTASWQRELQRQVPTEHLFNADTQT